MISIFIMIVIAISVCAAAGFGILTLMRSAETALLVQRNQVRIDTVVSSIRSYVRVDAQRVIVPLAVLEGASPPSDLKARMPAISPFTTTTWGAPLVYCPVAPADVGSPPSGVTSGVLVNDGSTGTETYDVEVTTLGGMAYVSAGGPGDADLRATLRSKRVVALVISPDPNSEAIPRCDAVTLGSDGSTFLVPGGTAVAIHDVPRLGDGQVFVLSSDGTLPAGYPAGANVVRSLIDAAVYIDGHGVKDATILIQNSGATVPVADLTALANETTGRTIRLSSGTAANTNLVVTGISGSELALTVDGELELSKVSLTAGAADVGFVTTSQGKLSVRDAGIGFIRNVGGDVILRGTANVSPGHSAAAIQTPVSSTGGRIVIDNVTTAVNSSGATTGVLMRGGDVSLIGGTSMTLTAGAPPFRVELGGRVLPATVGTGVSVNGAAAAPVESIATFGTTDSGGQTVSMSGKGTGRSLVYSVLQCADGSNNCSAACTGESVIAWGECSSSNDAPLAGFGAAADGRSWNCRWGSPATTVEPTAKAVCSKLP